MVPPQPEGGPHRVRDLLSRCEIDSIKPFDRYSSAGYAHSRGDGAAAAPCAAVAPSLECPASTSAHIAPAMTQEEQFAQLEHVVSGLVAHEVALDPLYRLTMPVDHDRGLEFALLARRIAREPTDTDAVAAVVADLRRGLLCATTAHGGCGHGRLRDRIRSNLDPALLASQVAHGVFNQTEVFDFVVDIVQLVCAPARDQEVADLASVKHAFVPFVLQARSLLHRMHEDILNYNLRSMRPAVVEFAVEVERATVLPFFVPSAKHQGSGAAPAAAVGGEGSARQAAPAACQTSDGAEGASPVHLHEKTRIWIQRGFNGVAAAAATATATATATASAAAERRCPSDAAASAVRLPSVPAVVVEAVVELVTRHGVAAVDCPETCELDTRRIVAWRKAAALSNLAASVHTIVRSAVPIGFGPRLVNDVMRTLVVLPLVASATTAAGVFAPATLAAVADAAVDLLQQYQAAVARPRQSYSGQAQLIRALAANPEAASDLEEHPVRCLLANRAREVLRIALLHGAAPTRPTPGLEAAHGILHQMATEILVFYRHNCRVFGELYASLVAAAATEAAETERNAEDVGTSSAAKAKQ